MAGTRAGGKNAAATNKAKYGDDFYAKIGAKGGKKGRTGGFYANRELASVAGALGGQVSRRGSSPVDDSTRKKLHDEAAKKLKAAKRQEETGKLMRMEQGFSYAA